MNSQLLKGLIKFPQCLTRTNILSVTVKEHKYIHLQTVNCRARQSTRLRKFLICRRNKALKEAKKLRAIPAAGVPYYTKKLKGEKFVSKKINDEDREKCPDNVWFADMFKLRVFSFDEAVDAHREIYDSSLYDDPDASINAYIELDMTTDKLTKFFESFTSVVPVNYPYKHNESRSILVFCKTKELLDAASEAGATLTGGTEVIKLVKKGKIMLPDFDFVIAHPNILTELLSIRGLLKMKFPSADKGSLGADLVNMVHSLKAGIKYEAKRDEIELDYGWVDVKLGNIQMENAHLEDNLRLILANISKNAPVRTKRLENYKFVRRVFITSASFNEKLLISAEDYLEESQKGYDSDEEEQKRIEEIEKTMFNK